MINIPKGTKDVLPNDSYKWQYLEDKARKTAKLFNLKEIRTPVFEHTELFLRGVGSTTDIVNKEMYTFNDLGGRSLTLKPEGTAGVARCYIENSLSQLPQPTKMFYLTPVFRYERPQAGRLREHHQFGVEIYGSAEPSMDAEVISIAYNFLKSIGISKLKLNINSIGCKECRKTYHEKLKDYLRPNLDKMCPTCRDRFEKNPLRILDCKEEGCIEINKNAPKMLDNLCDDCASHFEKLQEYIKVLGIDYEINPYIVRGLDYYTKTVFEFITECIGSQSTVCGGGRYDGLLEDLGGNKTPAVGFGLGLERLLLLMENTGNEIENRDNVKVYVAPISSEQKLDAIKLCKNLRENGISCETDHLNKSLKAQMKYADKIKAEYVIVLGEDEINSGVIIAKQMSTGEQTELKLDDLFDFFTK